METTKRTNKHSNAIRRNVELHSTIYGLIAERQEREGLTTYRAVVNMLTLHQREVVIGYRRITT